jgi:hypothetical protein
MIGALGLLKAVPIGAWVVAAVLGWGAFQKHRADAAGATLLRAQTEASQQREKALQDSLTETERRLTAQKEIVYEADRLTAKAITDAAAANTAVGRLQQRVAALQAAARAGHPAAAGSSPADRLGDALSACAGRYRDVAAAADRAVNAGRACERSYEALTPK